MNFRLGVTNVFPVSSVCSIYTLRFWHLLQVKVTGFTGITCSCQWSWKLDIRLQRQVLEAILSYNHMPTSIKFKLCDYIFETLHLNVYILATDPQ